MSNAPHECSNQRFRTFGIARDFSHERQTVSQVNPNQLQSKLFNFVHDKRTVSTHYNNLI